MSSWLCGERQRVHESSEEEAELDPGCPLSLSSIWSTVDSAILGEKVTVDNLTFRVERKLAEGGFGSILLAHSHDRQTVAIKRTLASAPELEHKARAEAYAMRFVQHPATMKLIAHAPGSVHNTLPFGQPPTRCYHLVTPAYLEGSLVTAWDCIRSDNSHCLRLATAEVVHLALQLAEGLDAMHSRGITHRDVTPSNVMLDSTIDDPRAVLTDFGSCRNSPIEVHTSHEAHETQDAAQSNTTAPCRPPELWYCQYPCTVCASTTFSACV
jgi:serine/threonine protein kinase